MKVLFAAAVLALSALPDAYTLQFENEWVRVTHVRYAPLAKLPPHAHTALASAYVYLNDAGPVIFRHTTGKRFVATRPATKAGSFRVFRGLDEIHEVENTTDVASEFLRVEFKTDPKDASTLRGRYFREPFPPGENVEKVQFENEQIRISRLVCASGKTLQVRTSATEPSLLIDLSSAPGQHQWLPAGRSESLVNDRSDPRELLRFDFKTQPVS